MTNVLRFELRLAKRYVKKVKVSAFAKADKKSCMSSGDFIKRKNNNQYGKLTEARER